MHSELREGFELSPQQKRVWTLQRADGTYVARCAALLEGKLQPEALKAALQLVVDRHDILRTTFYRQPGMKVPIQVIVERSLARWKEIDWSSLSREQQETKLEELFAEERRASFDFERGPLLRVTLAALADERHILFFSLPGICADAPTLKNLVREISSAYAIVVDGSGQLGEAVQYLQFAEWQNTLLDEDEAGREYWRGRQAIAPPPPLPFERLNGKAASFTTETRRIEINPPVAAAIEALARRYGLPVESYLFACWQILLWRLTGQIDILTGFICDGRKYEELKDGIGLYAKSLPVSSRFEENFRFHEIWRRVEEKTREALEWCESFDCVETNSTSPAALNGLPFSFEFAEWTPSLTAAGLKFSVIRQDACYEQFKVKLKCLRRYGELRCEFQYDPHYFAAPDIERLAARLSTLLEGATNNPEAFVNRLDILGEAERQQLLSEYNRTAVAALVPECFHQLFEQQVALTPDAPALNFEEQQLTYAELNARANQLARYLRKLGVGAETLVGICVERSAEMIVGVLGILKAGGAYLPLDPSHPKERNALTLVETGVRVVLVHHATRAKLGEMENVRVVCLEAEQVHLWRERADNPENEVDAQHLAYVLFTSGSAGRAKGVAIEHRQLVNYVKAIIARLNVAPGASFATVSTLAADLGNTSIFPALCTGGCLHVIAQERVADADALADYLARHPVDCLKIVPSHLNALLTSAHPERILPRQRLVLGGEASHPSLVATLRELAGECVVFNHYGPTETTVGVLTYRLGESDFDADTATLPIGRPLPNTEIYLLDSEQRLVPLGAGGELCIGGAGLARGYFNRPELTADKFIPNPFGTEPGARLYRTGDRARFLPDGQVEFLGRLDYQVKIRGFRIEPGEIEYALSAHQGVRQCVVVGREEANGETQLVAYVVLKQRASHTTVELREHLRRSLPDYMIPSAFVLLAELPLNRNGKLDRHALPPPEQMSTRASREGRAAANPVEEMLQSLWGEVLGMSEVGVEENFFELGGHSLLATQLVSRVRVAFGVELALRSLFEGPTVEAMGREIEEQLRGGVVGEERGGIERLEERGEMALSFAQQRLWFLSQLEPDNPFYNSGHVVLMNGPLNVGALEKTLNEIVRRHESLRTIFREVDGQPVQIILPAQPSPLQVEDLSELPAEAREAEAKRLNAEEITRRFDLAQGPLFRVRLLRLSDEQHVVMFTTHHIISDNWSMNVLLYEVKTLYSAFSKNEPAMLPELPVQYADFAHWQQQWLQGETLEAELDYWRRQLDGAPPTLDLPVDHPRPPVQTFRSNTKTLVLSESLTQSLKKFCREEGVTTFMALLAAFKVLLYRYTGQDDIVVGTPIAGRNRRELEGLIGFFLNTLVLRTKLSGALSFRELLGRVRDVTLGAFTHQELPFERLVQELQPKRELSRTPLFQVLMVFRNAQQLQSEVEGLTLTQLPVEVGWSNFDLTLWASESFDKLSINLEYNADLFEDATINRMAEHFRQLLESVVAEPQQRLADVPMLSGPERHQILIEWNDTLRDFPLANCFQELFEQQVEQHADRIAAVCEGQTLTYRELNTRANRIAHRLVARGARAETIIALLGERSLFFLVVMVAIFKTGAAYLPLDPRSPEKRWRQIIEQSRASLVIADTEFIAPIERALQNDADEAHSPVLLSSGELLDQHAGQGEEDENLPHRSAPDNLAYIIYTSGSTGVPKGAMIEHRGMLNHLYAKIQDLSLTADDVVAQTASQSFDISVWQFLAPLLAGGRTHIFDDRIAHDALQLLPQVDEQGITIWETVPSLLRAVLTEMPQANGNLSKLESLRWLIPTGEELPPELCRQWLEHYAHVPLVNAYGPTECSDDVSHHKVSMPPPVTQTNLPIGRPVGNLQLYVVDDALQPVAIGVSGELCVGGVGVGRGYLNDAWRTAQVFIPDQLSGQLGARLYRTGDRARYLPGGEIEYLGRLDQQIKVRGYRVELGEIESLLNQHPSVKTAVVTAREEMAGGRRLVGYVVGQEVEVESGELRRYLKEKLPEYMVPSVFVNLTEIPLTPNGKIDRKALPAPDASPLAETYLGPRNEIEETIAGILRETLELKQVGVHDDFFELGGHSLLATRVTARLRERFQIDLSLRAIFERPTVAGLAADIARLRSEQRGQLEAELLAELDQLSEEEAAALLDNLSLTERGEASA